MRGQPRDACQAYCVVNILSNAGRCCCCRSCCCPVIYTGRVRRCTELLPCNLHRPRPPMPRAAALLLLSTLIVHRAANCAPTHLAAALLLLLLPIRPSYSFCCSAVDPLLLLPLLLRPACTVSGFALRIVNR